jgi:UDP-glucose 4-epimerase
MNILVTGGAGFIGSHLVDRLLKDGHHVAVIDNLFTGKTANLRQHAAEPRFSFVEDSLLNERALEPLVAESELIYHLAAVVGVKHVIDNPLDGLHANLQGTENVLAMAEQYGVKCVVVSSSEVYGKSEKAPLSEDDDCLYGPTNVTRWWYALSKAVDEHLALIYHRRGLPVTIVRYFNAYGPRLDPRGYGSVIAKFINQALKNQPLTVYDDGRQSRCFTYVEDTVNGTVLAGQTPAAEGQAFNIGAEAEITIRELAELIRQLTGSAAPIVTVPYQQAYGPHFEETRRRLPDTRKARELLGFTADISLVDGLSRTINWFKNEKPQENENDTTESDLR